MALDAQNDLRHSFNTREGRGYMEGFVQSLMKPSKTFDVNTGEISDHEGSKAVAERCVGAAVGSVEHGETTWVSSEVLDLVEVAAEQFEPEAIFPDDMFAPIAFTYFERPIFVLDHHGKRLSFRALSWIRWKTPENPGRQGVILATWAHHKDPDAYSDEHFGLVGGSALTLSHVSSPLEFGEDRVLAEPTHRQLFKIVQVMWRLAQQEIVLPRMQQVSRSVWRRKSNWRQIKTVQVLTLRRLRQARYEGEEREVEWSHRWMVGGHWRNQPYKIGGKWVRRQIWINPYVKGPEEKPFIAKKHVIEFRR